MIKKTLGLLFIIIGLAVISYSLYTSFNIFSGKIASPEIFKAPSATQNVSSQDMQSQVQNMIGEQLKGMLPVDSITTLFNLISWSVFAGILIFGGAQIAGLGIKLLN
ncbi:MAG: hypothetical protein ABIB55_03105 [Candidatus Nealsonbacteria bacterium]